jgi:hypothetical protein
MTPDLEAVAAALQEYPHGLGNLFRLLLHHHGCVLNKQQCPELRLKDIGKGREY